MYHLRRTVYTSVLDIWNRQLRSITISAPECSRKEWNRQVEIADGAVSGMIKRLHELDL